MSPIKHVFVLMLENRSFDHMLGLSALARELAVCDSWFCSMPGPTWPNRFFALGASSAGLDRAEGGLG